jgi:hypothetical protein
LISVTGTGTKYEQFTSLQPQSQSQLSASSATDNKVEEEENTNTNTNGNSEVSSASSKKEDQILASPTLKRSRLVHHLTAHPSHSPFGALLRAFEQLIDSSSTQNAQIQKERIDIFNQYGCISSTVCKLLHILRFFILFIFHFLFTRNCFFFLSAINLSLHNAHFGFSFVTFFVELFSMFFTQIKPKSKRMGQRRHGTIQECGVTNEEASSFSY